jgi:Glycosyl transferases group 1.
MDYPIRILHIVTHMNRGGTESRLMDLYRVLDRTRFQFDFYTLRKHKGDYDDEIISLGGRVIYNSPITAFSLGKNRKEFRNFIQNNRYDIVHCHLTELSPIFLAVAKQCGIKNRIVHSRRADVKGGLKAIYKKIMKKFIPLYATHYYTVSDKAGYWLYGRRLMESGKVVRINNAVDAQKFRFDETVREIKRNELGLKDNNMVVGLVGNFTYPKNHLFLLDIFSSIRKIDDNAVLVLVGDGAYRKAIEGKISQLGLSGHVRLLGKRTDVADCPCFRRRQREYLPEVCRIFYKDKNRYRRYAR